MDARNTPGRPIPGVPRHTPDPTLERGFVASLRWLVSEGESRGVRRIAVELRALREALTTLDETRQSRDTSAEKANALEKEIKTAIDLLGSATLKDGNGNLVDRLLKLREIISKDLARRKALIEERDSWRAMCELQTRTRAMVHQLLEESERQREELESESGILRDRVSMLVTLHKDAVSEADDHKKKLYDAETVVKQLEESNSTLTLKLEESKKELESIAILQEKIQSLHRDRDRAITDARNSAVELMELRVRLHQWSSTVENALAELARAAGAIGVEGRIIED